MSFYFIYKIVLNSFSCLTTKDDDNSYTNNKTMQLLLRPPTVNTTLEYLKCTNEFEKNNKHLFVFDNLDSDIYTENNKLPLLKEIDINDITESRDFSIYYNNLIKRFICYVCSLRLKTSFLLPNKDIQENTHIKRYYSEIVQNFVDIMRYKLEPDDTNDLMASIRNNEEKKLEYMLYYVFMSNIYIYQEVIKQYCMKNVLEEYFIILHGEYVRFCNEYQNSKTLDEKFTRLHEIGLYITSQIRT